MTVVILLRKIKYKNIVQNLHSSFRVDNNGDFRLPFRFKIEKELVMIKQGAYGHDILRLIESRKHRVQQIHSGMLTRNFQMLELLTFIMLSHESNRFYNAVDYDKEELIEEQRTDWKRSESVKSCIKRNISLNDNAEQNKKKLFI
ncbi:41184_t:CDS:2 [Gigaspora margarita]|uniref:41184_t:CDS:1 n=1 Tax=Gigaspora margarita TaxID=4874 RepID=A0ABN7VZ39_GIGMA|nr:41184_t:CDS:2 [Gigaspora margarita]